MKLRELYESLHAKFASRSDPDAWWPIYYGRTEPPEFERTITNVLVTRSTWRSVRPGVDALDRAGLLTARGLATAAEAESAACVKPPGFQSGKAECLKALGALVLAEFENEAGFCRHVTREQLLAVRRGGPETADRILLYTCGRLAWPCDAYCFRVLARHGIIGGQPEGRREKERAAQAIKQQVEAEMPRVLEDWRRLHALMQLEGQELGPQARAIG